MDSVSNKFNVARSVGRRSRPMELPQAAMPAPPAPDRGNGLGDAMSGLASSYQSARKNRGSDLAPKTSTRPKTNPRY